MRSYAAQGGLMICDDYTWLRLTQGRFGVVVLMQPLAFRTRSCGFFFFFFFSHLSCIVGRVGKAGCAAPRPCVYTRCAVPNGDEASMLALALGLPLLE